MVLLSAFGFACAQSAFAETEVSWDEVPVNVRDVAENTAPGIDFVKVSVEIENGVVIYEFEGETYDGRHVEVDVTEDGRLDEIEMEETEADLPEAVVAAIQEARPGSIILLVETSISGAGEFRYEVEVETPEGGSVAFNILENGEIVGVEDAALS
ncbi:MAG: hypothetical protein AAF224_13135 [Pseudomonadota bacterium]